MSHASRVYLLVDGHSVIYAWPELRSLHYQRPAQARDELTKVLQLLHDTSHWRVTIVFDGRQGKSPPRRKGDIVVSYSQKNETADAVIERLCHVPGLGPKIVVVTADSAERLMVESAGASCYSPDWLRAECESFRSDFESTMRELNRRARW